MSEQHRITDILKSYWEQAKGNRPFPEEGDIDQAQLEAIWDSCFLIKLLNGRYVYSFLGKSIIEAYGDNLEGEEIVEDLLYPESPDVVGKFEEVAEAKEPLIYEGGFINKNNMDIKFRKALLPLGKDGKITHIIGGMRWRAF